MRIARICNGVAMALLLHVPVARGQAARAMDSSASVLVSSPSSIQASAVSPGDIVREIDDPHTGDRWLLVRGYTHPGGPGLLLLVSAVKVASRQTEAGAEIPPPIIRVGDRVVVEENTAVIEARLEAIALSPATAGSALNVRLTLGGRMVRVVAVGPGRAAFQGETQR